jgi:glutamyl endopeptidase
MHSTPVLQRVHIFQRIAVLGLLLAALLASVAPISAQSSQGTKQVENPHTIVSSDGSTPAASTAGSVQDSAGLYSPSFAGANELPKGDKKSDAGTNVQPLPKDQAGISSVIGTDNRYQITATTSFPYRAIAQISFTSGGSTYGCTGWLINANTVATAGHCVYDNGAWSTNVVVYPGRNGSSMPYGSCGYSRLYSVTGWTSSRNPEYDYGVIKLNCSIGNTTGWFGYRWQSASLTGQPTYLAGYPCDKPYPTMWRHDDSVRVTETRRIYYANDTYGCQSGAPVWNNEASCSTCGIAIHAYGVGSNGYNGGTRITQEVYNNLTTWKNS